MRYLLWLSLIWLTAPQLAAQSFGIGPLQDVYKGYIGETLRVPITLTNNSEAPVSLVVKRVQATLGSTQKDYFCPSDDCFQTPADGIVIRLAPGESLEDFEVALDAGLAGGISSMEYVVFNRQNPGEALAFNLNFAIEERSAADDIFTHPEIVLHDVYPNPVVDFAFVNYDLVNPNLEAKIVIHNILGNPIDEYLLPQTENVVRIRTETLTTGIYFYTLYLDNEGVITRKLIVKKQ